MRAYLRAPRLLSSLLLAGSLVAIAEPARAQTDEQRATARSLATEGATAFNEGRWKEAVDLFTRAESLVHAPPHLLFLARAHHKLGQLVKAREAYLKIIKETLAPNAPRAFRDAQAAAEQELKEVEPRIASLAVKVEGPPELKDVVVTVNGTPMPSVVIGVSRPIDPGQHQIEASAPGYLPKKESVTLKDAERKAITLKLEVDPNATATPVAAPAATSTPSVAAPPTDPVLTPGSNIPPTQDTGTTDKTNTLRLGSYVAFGVGAVGVGLGAFMLANSASKRGDADDLHSECEAQSGVGRCLNSDSRSGEVADLDDEARSAFTLSLIGFGVGAVGIGTGITLFVLSNQSENKAQSAKIEPWFGLNSAGVRGTF